MLKVGLIGAGFIGIEHANAYKNLDNVRLAAIADANEEIGKKVAEEFNCDYYSDADEMMKSDDIDIIDICVPTFLHEKYALMAASYKKHILCEKPFTLTVESADKIVEAAKEAGVKLMVGQVLRFWPEYMKIRELYNDNKTGKIKTVHAHRLAQHPDWSSWFLDVNKSGGGLFDLHIHDIDYVRHLFGPVSSVYATGSQSDNGAWNNVISILNFKNGVSARVEAASDMTDGYPFSMGFRISGEEGTIDFDFSSGFNIEDRGSVKSNFVYYKNGSDPMPIEAEQSDPFTNEIKYFAECILENKDLEVITPEESRDVIRIITAIRKALETNEVQKLD